MSGSSLFVGLVTHPTSRFNVDGAAAQKARDLVGELTRAGVPAELLVSDDNDYDAAVYPLDRAELLRSARYWSDLEYRWRRYLAEGGGRPARSSAVDRAWALAMSGKRQAEALRDRSARTSAIRLINIDLSHLRVLETARASGRPWTLVLEDDAGYGDPAGTAAALADVIERVDGTGVQFVNLSESIDLDRLGVDGIVLPPADGEPSTPAVWSCRRPVTNTVCANLYRTGFAGVVAEGIRGAGLLPVAPIDWRVNERILDGHRRGLLGPDSFAWVRPGIFVQGSMHDPR